MTTPNPTAVSTQPSTGYTPPVRNTYRSKAAYIASQSAQTVSVPKGIPQFMGHASTMIMAWAVAMAIITVDEWHVNKILPRPSRLWWTTLVYGILAVVGMSSALLPLANALAIGYTIVLLYQYFNKSGQFA